MSNATNGAPLATQDAESTRRRHAQDVAKLLKEYTAVMYEIAERITVYLDAGTRPDKLPRSVFLAVWRYRSVWEPMREAALFASQMLVHYQLDEADAAELRLRLADAENGIELTGILINDLRGQNGGGIVKQPVSMDDLNLFIELLRIEPLMKK